MQEWGWLVGLGIALIMIGVLLVFLGVLAASLGSGGGEGEVEAGGVVVIGPIPIIFGTSSKAALAAAVLGLIMMLLALLMWLQARGVQG